MDSNNITSLPDYIIGVERLQNEVDHGDVEFSLKKVGGNVVSLSTSKKRVIKFKKGDNREVLLVIADILNTLPKDSTIKSNIEYEAKNGKVTKLSITSEKRTIF